MTNFRRRISPTEHKERKKKEPPRIEAGLAFYLSLFISQLHPLSFASLADDLFLQLRPAKQATAHPKQRRA
jgi:hypothetical protein